MRTDSINQKQFGLSKWATFAGCCLLCAFAFALPLPCFGVFVSPLVAQFKCTVTEVNLYFTFMTAAAIVSCAFGARLLELNMKAVIIGCCVAMATGYLALAMFPSVTLVWVAGIIAGLGYPLCTTVLVPIAINDAFDTNQGTLIGIAFAVIGVAGVVFGPVLTALISAFGWGFAMCVVAISIAVTGVVSALFLLGGSSKKGQAAKAPSSEQQGQSKAHLPRFTMLFIALACVFAGVLGDYNTQVNAIAQQSGFDPAIAAVAFSFVSGSLVVGKVALGWLRDHFGAKASMAVSCAIGIVAFALSVLALSWQSMTLLYVSSALAGICTCLGTIGPALLVGEAFGAAAYARALALATAFCNMGMAIGAPLYSLSFDLTGSYVPILVLCAILPIATFATAIVGMGQEHRE